MGISVAPHMGKVSYSQAASAVNNNTMPANTQSAPDNNAALSNKAAPNAWSNAPASIKRGPNSKVASGNKTALQVKQAPAAWSKTPSSVKAVPGKQSASGPTSANRASGMTCGESPLHNFEDLKAAMPKASTGPKKRSQWAKVKNPNPGVTVHTLRGPATYRAWDEDTTDEEAGQLHRYKGKQRRKDDARNAIDDESGSDPEFL